MKYLLRTQQEVRCLNVGNIEVNEFWNVGGEKEKDIHRIHAYPAKFPAFITTKALEFAQKEGLKPKLIADIFCGCGTVAFEAKRNDIDFWGCDINPVATMIAKVKSQNYLPEKLIDYYENIVRGYNESYSIIYNYKEANERLKYWYTEESFSELSRLKQAIEESIPRKSHYRNFFMCAFSNILKTTSKWLTKSIKPQVDPGKKPESVMIVFEKQFRFMVNAITQVETSKRAKTNIKNINFVGSKYTKPKVDMIITSPPYVTSYEYADLHQLSSTWLGYADDYRELRKGSIGSLFHINNLELQELNETGAQIFEELLNKDKRQALAVAKYFLDMQKTAYKCVEMLKENGIAVFVIGDTEYKGVRIENSKHLSEALIKSGMKEIEITKRKISGKILTPYRDREGKFSKDKNDKKIYSEEFIVIGRK